MISLNRLHYSVAFLTLSILIIPFVSYFPEDSFTFESSVWCFNSTTNLCTFKNTCYDPKFKAFLFFLTENSIINGLEHYKELQKIELSSVRQHNQFYTNLSVIDVKNFKLPKQFKIHSKGLLLSRFKPNNLMHVIHDDLFPLYLTLESLCLGDAQCIESYSLVFHDNHPRGPFYFLYELFSKYAPIMLNKSTGLLLCFKQMHTGLVRDSVVYQYGFKKPHGPLKPTKLTQNDISRFTGFVKSKLNIFNEVNGTDDIILLSRQKTRKIFNVGNVKKMIQSGYEKLHKKIKIRQVDLDLSSSDLKALLKIISQTDGVVGMHGAEMILSLFLKPNSFVFEIFPFGINPNVVSFIKPISEVNGCNFVYFSWKNVWKNNSITHPDAPPLYGGISHLDLKTQTNIKNAQEVPAIECCNNPLFLYHMYQDTFISHDFELFFYQSISKIFKQTTHSSEIITKWFHPYTVFNISCIFHQDENFLNISWDPPFNVENHDSLIYSLYIKDRNGLLSEDVLTKKTKLEIKTPNGVEPNFEVWISVQFSKNGFKSPDLYVNCL